MQQSKRLHESELLFFLQHNFAAINWTFAQPEGSGNETYFAHGGEHHLFVKIGAHIERAAAMSQAGLTPPVLANGTLEDGKSILVQALIDGRKPTRKDYHDRLEQFARAIHRMHHDPGVKAALPSATVHLYSDSALAAVEECRQRWSLYRPHVPEVAPFVDSSLDELEEQSRWLQGSGMVASHNDLCNDNMLITEDGQLYIIDLEMMSLGDPADDVGTLLWWYYPPRMRRAFLDIAGYSSDSHFEDRMKMRVPLHLLRITLPRSDSFDSFDPASYGGALADFKAAILGRDNPQGYADRLLQ